MSRAITFCYDLLCSLTRKANWHAIRHSIRFMMQYFNSSWLTGVEIGVLLGANSINLLNNLNIKELFLIDPYQDYDGIDGPAPYDENYAIAQRNLRDYPNRTFVRKKSENATELVPDGLDFVYVDGNHKYEYIKKDIELFYPKLRAGGVMCGHDFDLPDVASAVTEFGRQHGKKIFSQGYPGDWWYVK